MMTGVMKTIVFTGDSHTWGEGASLGAPLDYFCDGSPAVPGDLRRMRRDYPSFVSLIAAWIEREYPGVYRIVNSGIGSCPARRYVTEYWEEWVAAHKPEIIVIQPHTINDWLTREGAARYKKDLDAYVRKACQTAHKVLLTTVSPILGEQKRSGRSDGYCLFDSCSDSYADYVSVIPQVAVARRVPLADVYPLLGDPAYFADNWHVNNAGHKIYAETVWKQLLNHKYI